MRAVSQPSPSPARCASRIRTCRSRSTTPRRSSGGPTAIPSGSRSWVTSATTSSSSPSTRPTPACTRCGTPWRTWSRTRSRPSGRSSGRRPGIRPRATTSWRASATSRSSSASTSPGPRPGSSRRTASAKPAQGIERGVMTSDTARMYLDGKWVHARGGATFDVVNPADSSVVATVSDAGPSEAQRAVEAAHGAFREWSARPARERAQVLLNIQSLMEERRDVLARLITTENGKPFEEARKEVQFALAYFGWFAEQARRVTGEWVPSPHAGKRTWVLRQPVGPVAAVEGAVAIKYLRVAGQSCIAANRIYVHRSVADRFVPAFADAVRALRVGPGFERGVQVGPLISAQARTRIHALVEDAVRRGARLATGGHPLTDGVRARGSFSAPTVLLDATEEMAVAREEIFGPVAPILTFDTVDEVVARANATTYGLGAYVYTRDLGRALSLAERLEYGLIGVNDASGDTHEIPFGGFTQSGLGREGGEEGIDQYLETKSVVVNIS